MNTMTTKGLPRSIVKAGNLVEVWCSSPTGDSSDSHIFTIPCRDEAQAEQVFQAWSAMLDTLATA